MWLSVVITESGFARRLELNCQPELHSPLRGQPRKHAPASSHTWSLLWFIPRCPPRASCYEMGLLEDDWDVLWLTCCWEVAPGEKHGTEGVT